jgi:hypothetical protein
MPIHDQLFAAAGRPVLMGQFGDDAGLDYTHPDGTADGHFEAIVGPERTEEQPALDGRILRRVREVKIPRQEGLPFWDEVPSSFGRFTYREIEYAVDVIEAVTENFIYLRLLRVAAAEHSRPGYRRK